MPLSEEARASTEDPGAVDLAPLGRGDTGGIQTAILWARCSFERRSRGRGVSDDAKSSRSAQTVAKTGQRAAPAAFATRARSRRLPMAKELEAQRLSACTRVKRTGAFELTRSSGCSRRTPSRHLHTLPVTPSCCRLRPYYVRPPSFSFSLPRPFPFTPSTSSPPSPYPALPSSLPPGFSRLSAKSLPPAALISPLSPDYPSVHRHLSTEPLLSPSLFPSFPLSLTPNRA
jgi:hypothetical protein